MTRPGQQGATAAVLGRIGLPEPVRALAAEEMGCDRDRCGAQRTRLRGLSRAGGQRVLVLESRDVVGGACTLEEPWPGVRMSPCAYVVGLLHPLVMRELDLPGHGFRWTPAAGGMFVPFEDGSSIQLWNDDERCEEEIRRFAPGDLAGWREMHGGEAPAAGRAPARQRRRHLDRPLAHARGDRAAAQGDRDAEALLFEWSMVEMVERFLSDERMQLAYLGQGVIGTNASPHDRGTASI